MATALRADVKLPHLISDGMALERGRPVWILGTADPGEKISVSFHSQAASVAAGSDGTWKLQMGPYERRPVYARCERQEHARDHPAALQIHVRQIENQDRRQRAVSTSPTQRSTAIRSWCGLLRQLVLWPYVTVFPGCPGATFITRRASRLLPFAQMTGRRQVRSIRFWGAI